jgi:hypothetical protein
VTAVVAVVPATVVVVPAVAVVVVPASAATPAVVEAAASSVAATAAAVLIALRGCDVAFGESGLGEVDALEENGFVCVCRSEGGHFVVNPVKR